MRPASKSGAPSISRAATAYGWVRPRTGCPGWCASRPSFDCAAGTPRFASGKPLAGQSTTAAGRHQGSMTCAPTRLVCSSGDRGCQHATRPKSVGGPPHPYADHIVVFCQNDRSQPTAIAPSLAECCAARLYESSLTKREEAAPSRRGQDRYRLRPPDDSLLRAAAYQMVKDCRTVGDANTVGRARRRSRSLHGRRRGRRRRSAAAPARSRTGVGPMLVPKCPPPTAFYSPHQTLG